MALSNGVYYISCVETGTFLQFDTGDAGITMTAWHFSGSKAQQWEITSSTAAESYIVRNLGSQTYPAWSGVKPASGYPSVVSDTSATVWYIEALDNTNFTIASDTFFNYTWNVDGGFDDDDNPIILFPFDAATDVNGRFHIAAVDPAAIGTTTTGTTSSTPATAGAMTSTTTDANTPTATGANIPATIVSETPGAISVAAAATSASGKPGLIGGTSTTGISASGTTGVKTPPVISGATGSTSASGKKAGIISGASVGGLAVVVGLLILAFLQAHHLWYMFASFGFGIFGWWLFGRRQFVFSSDRNVGQLEISLFLSFQKTIRDSEDGSLLIWQVFRIGHSRTMFSIFCPCVRGSPGGQTRLGFGIVNDVDDEKRINSELREAAPVAWNGDELLRLESEGEKIIFKNDHDVESDIALGTYENVKDARSVFKPFLRINGLQWAGNKHEVNEDLYVHAFVTHGYRDGQYGMTLVSDVMADMLTQSGIKLTDLKPVSFWHISKVKERLKLKINGCLNEMQAV